MKKPKVVNSKTGYDLHANFYDKKLAFLDSFEQNQLLPLLGDVKNKKILDVGAGTGRLAIRLAEKGVDVTALDISPEILKILSKKNKKIKTITADAKALPFPDNSFDVIVAAFLIVHLKELKYFFAESYRVLKPGGLLALTNINQKKPPELQTKQGKIIVESYYHRPEKIIEELKQNLFTVSKNILIKDKDVWINQIVIGEK
ncbi:MAG TPA: methyltransferase domain-containing protein [bacterium]|nr:methyltransferase domain-containing protein [bacterium]HPL95827.1 methyltransferase domain-containing protein [bacterium]